MPKKYISVSRLLYYIVIKPFKVIPCSHTSCIADDFKKNVHSRDVQILFIEQGLKISFSSFLSQFTK